MSNIKIHIEFPQTAIETSMRYDKKRDIFFVTGSVSNGYFKNFLGTIPIIMKNNAKRLKREGVYAIGIVPSETLPNTKMKKVFTIYRIPRLDSKKSASHEVQPQEFTEELH